MNQTALAADPRAGRRPAPTHGPRPAQACPGRCGHQVPVELICCRTCWYRLPLGLRQVIHAICCRSTTNRRRAAIAQAAAIAAARYWFRRQEATSA
jgi:hypothetical protein